MSHHSSELDAKISEMQSSLGPLAGLLTQNARAASSSARPAANNELLAAAREYETALVGDLPLSASSAPSPTPATNYSQPPPLSSFLVPSSEAVHVPAVAPQTLSAPLRSASPSLMSASAAPSPPPHDADVRARSPDALLTRIRTECGSRAELARVLGDLASSADAKAYISCAALRDALALRACDLSASEAAALAAAFPSAEAPGQMSAEAFLDAIDSITVSEAAQNGVPSIMAPAHSSALSVSASADGREPAPSNLPRATAGLALPSLAPPRAPSAFSPAAPTKSSAERSSPGIERGPNTSAPAKAAVVSAGTSPYKVPIKTTSAEAPMTASPSKSAVVATSRPSSTVPRISKSMTGDVAATDSGCPPPPPELVSAYPTEAATPKVSVAPVVLDSTSTLKDAAAPTTLNSTSTVTASVTASAPLPSAPALPPTPLTEAPAAAPALVAAQPAIGGPLQTELPRAGTPLAPLPVTAPKPAPPPASPVDLSFASPAPPVAISPAVQRLLATPRLSPMGAASAVETTIRAPVDVILSSSPVSRQAMGASSSPTSLLPQSPKTEREVELEATVVALKQELAAVDGEFFEHLEDMKFAAAQAVTSTLAPGSPLTEPTTVQVARGRQWDPSPFPLPPRLPSTPTIPRSRSESPRSAPASPRTKSPERAITQAVHAANAKAVAPSMVLDSAAAEALGALFSLPMGGGGAAVPAPVLSEPAPAPPPALREFSGRASVGSRASRGLRPESRGVSSPVTVDDLAALRSAWDAAAATAPSRPFSVGPPPVPTAAQTPIPSTRDGASSKAPLLASELGDSPSGATFIARSNTSSPLSQQQSPTSSGISAAKLSPKQKAEIALAAAASSVIAADAAIAAAQAALGKSPAAQSALGWSPTNAGDVDGSRAHSSSPQNEVTIESGAFRGGAAVSGRDTPPPASPESIDAPESIYEGATAAKKSPTLPIRPAQPSPRAAQPGEPRSADVAFPHATDVEYSLRAAVRKALWGKAQAAGVAHSTSRRPASVTSAVGPDPDDVLFLLAPLSPTLAKSLALVFKRFEVPPPPRGWPVKTTNRVTERLRKAISNLQFSEGVSTLLGTRLDPVDLASLIRNLRLDVMGKTNHQAFIEFCSLPLTRSYAVAKKPDEAPAGGPTALVDGDECIVYSTEGAPRPISTPLSPVKRTPAVPANIALRATHAAVSSPKRKLSVASHMSIAPDSSSSAAGVRPRVSVPWPCDISDAKSPFWVGVAALEAALIKETKKRSTIFGTAPRGEPPAVTAAGANVTAAVTAREAMSLLGPTSDPSCIYASRNNLRRAFLFFDRRGEHAFSVLDLHQTLAELGLVDAPAAQTRRAPDDNDEGEGGVVTPLAAALALPQTEATIVGLKSPSRLRRQPEGGDRGEGGVLVHVHAARPSHESFVSRASAEVRALEDAWMQLSSDAGAGGVGDGSLPVMGSLTASSAASATLPFGLAAPPTWDPLAAELTGGARALVCALFRRLLGHSDPGTTRLSSRGFSLGGEPTETINFATFARWAHPLSLHLQRMREQIQSAFLAATYTGSGVRDVDRIFKKLDLNSNGLLTTNAFIAAIGPLARFLDPQEIAALVEHFDPDGSGAIDVREFCALLKSSDGPDAPEGTDEGAESAGPPPAIVDGAWVNLPQ